MFAIEWLNICDMNLLFRSILGRPWAIDPRFVEANASFISSMLESGKIDNLPDMRFSEHYVVGASGLRTNHAINNAAKGSIAIIEVRGPMMKNDQDCGPAGTASIASWIRQADSNPNIDGIVLVTDAPGGTVDGTEELARTVANVKKPIVGFIDGLAASAAYWMISQTDEIIASGKTSEAGSIGVMSSWADIKPVMEKAGIRFHEVYATKSTEKNASFREALQGNYDRLIAELDKINDVFEAAVRKGRAKIKDSVFSGDVYFSEDAKKMGLIDSIGTLEDAIKAVSRIKNSRTMSKNNNATTYPNFAQAAGFTEGFEMNEEGVYVNSESLQAVETALANGAQAQTDLQALQTSTSTEAVNSLNEQVNNLTQERDTLQARVAELEGKPHNKGGQPAGKIGVEIEGKEEETQYVDDGSEAWLNARLRN